MLEAKKVAEFDFKGYITGGNAQSSKADKFFEDYQGKIVMLSAEALEVFVFMHLQLIKDSISLGSLSEGFQIGVDFVFFLREELGKLASDNRARICSQVWLAVVCEGILLLNEFAPSNSDPKTISQRLVLFQFRKDLLLKLGTSLYDFNPEIIRVGCISSQIDALLSEWEEPAKPLRKIEINSASWKLVSSFHFAKEKLKDFFSFISTLSELNNEMRSMQLRTTEVLCSIENILMRLAVPE